MESFLEFLVELLPKAKGYPIFCLVWVGFVVGQRLDGFPDRLENLA
jgi:hypothetical protein